MTVNERWMLQAPHDGRPAAERVEHKGRLHVLIQKTARAATLAAFLGSAASPMALAQNYRAQPVSTAPSGDWSVTAQWIGAGLMALLLYQLAKEGGGFESVPAGGQGYSPEDDKEKKKEQDPVRYTPPIGGEKGLYGRCHHVGC